MWSGCKENEENYYGVALCVKTELVKNGTVSEPNCHNDRIMTITINQNKSKAVLVNCYAPTLVSNAESLDTFYEELRKVIEEIPKSYDLILAGDFNARVGSDHERWRGTLGPHGIGQINQSGQRLLELAVQYNLRISNTFFQLKNHYKSTWQHPRSKTWHTIDYIITRKSNRSQMLRCKVMRGAECETDHKMIRATIKLKLNPKQAKRTNKMVYDSSKLGSEEVRNTFHDKIQEKYYASNTNMQNETAEEAWTRVKQIYTTTAQEILGKKKIKTQDWFDESETLVEKELENKRKAHERLLTSPASEALKKQYQEARQKCQHEIRRIREEWWNKKINELQEYANKNDTYNLYRGITSIVGPIRKPLNIIENKNGIKLSNKEDRLDRWREHFQHVFNQQTTVRLEDLEINPILTEVPSDERPSEGEITTAINQMKNRKSPGSDAITAEIIKGGNTLSVKMLHEVFGKIWEEKTVPQEWRNSEIVPIFKKGKKTCCDNYRGISLLSIPGKVLARVIYNRLVPFLEQFWDETQSGFRSNRSTADMVFSTRQLIEKAKEQNTQLAIGFVDISKAFDSVNRAALFEILYKLNCPPNLLEVLKSLHTQTYATAKIEGEISKPFELQSGVRQGCVIAPLLFITYMQTIMNQIKRLTNVRVKLEVRDDTNMFCKRSFGAKTKIKERSILDLLFADDCALVANTAEELQDVLNIFARTASKLGLQVNVKKTEVMFINSPPSPIEINGGQLKLVDSFKYLGSRIANTNDIDVEVTARINAAAQAFGRLYTRVWKPHNLSLKTKLLVYNTVVLSTLLYAAETWTVHKRHLNRLNSFHLRCLRSITRTSWKDKVPNEQILDQTNMKSIEDMLRIKRLRWAGHISRMTNEKIPKQVAFSQLAKGKRLQVKPKKRWSDILKEDLKICHIDEKKWRESAENRNEWRRKIHTETEQTRVQNIEKAKKRREERHQIEDTFDWKCPVCDFRRSGKTGRQYVQSHITQAHHQQRPVIIQSNTAQLCEICGFRCTSKSGMSSHKRHKHPDAPNYELRPQKIPQAVDLPATQTPAATSSITTTTPSQHTCPHCGRTCRTRPGLLSHMRSSTCQRQTGTNAATSDR